MPCSLTTSRPVSYVMTKPELVVDKTAIDQIRLLTSD